jgi:hypothetical protein
MIFIINIHTVSVNIGANSGDKKYFFIISPFVCGLNFKFLKFRIQEKIYCFYFMTLLG